MNIDSIKRLTEFTTETTEYNPNNDIEDQSPICDLSDDSDNYVPAYSVDQINDVDSDEGYRVFLNGGDTQVLPLDGLPVDVNILYSL